MRRISIVLLALVLLTLPLLAVGTATLTGPTVVINQNGRRLLKYSIAWTSTAGGAVSANTFTPAPGKLLQIEYIPGGGGTQPSDMYDVTLVDANSVDMLVGGGANLSNAAATIQRLDPPVVLDGTQTLDLVVANAGAAKTGTVVLLQEN